MTRRLLIILSATLLLTSCKSLQQFMSRDLEDEDFVVGQLYVDEVVPETPVIARPVRAVPDSKQNNSGNANTQQTNPLGLTYSPNDNAALYEIVNEWLGVPYLYGGNDRDGIDCSAFVGVVYRQIYGINLHRTSNDMLRDVDLIGRSELREGDIVFFTNSKGKVSHVGVYLKDDLFAHSSTSNGVSVSNLEDSYWQKHFYKGGRVNK
ncbi:MAG: C40 family peptidase [Bacteroidales bacterium]|nr:C40 family peptidase [Bacteroidales bacterium]